jgi:hypothetical protein
MERPVRGLRFDRLVRSKALQCIRRGTRQDDGGELGRVEARLTFTEAGALEEARVEADVVSDERRVGAEERDQAGEGVVERRCSREVLGTDTREAGDRRAERAARIDESDELVRDDVVAARAYREARSADLDDPVVVRIEAGRLEVDRDESLRWSLF